MTERTNHSEYWRDFRQYVLGSSYQFPPMGIRIGEFTGKTIHGPHYHLVAWTNSTREGNDAECRFIRCGIVIHEKAGPGSAKRRFDRLLEFQQEINNAFGSGCRLDWERKDNRKETQILLWDKVDPEDKDDWPRQFEWLAELLEKFYKIFPPYIKSVEDDVAD